MAKRTRRTGLPKELEQEQLDQEHHQQEPTMEEFIQEMHGQADQPQKDLPSLEWLKEKFQTKSAAIRYLISLGIEVKVIQKHLGVRYQHVRNVAKTPLKRGPNEDWRKPYLESQQIPDLKQFQPPED